MKRRHWLQTTFRLAAGLALLPVAGLSQAFAPVRKSKEEWRALLPGRAYAVLFQEATEHPGSSPLNKEKRSGTYVCAACHQPLFTSEKKYDSRTGWPSFFDAIPAAVETRLDRRMMIPRTEYHCSRCGGHQGHVFKDGPRPTGLRYCNNGIALLFVAAGTPLPELRT
jgi:peptide-methionine (R)-S-oxide reductase